VGKNVEMMKRYWLNQCGNGAKLKASAIGEIMSLGEINNQRIS